MIRQAYGVVLSVLVCCSCVAETESGNPLELEKSIEKPYALTWLLRCPDGKRCDHIGTKLWLTKDDYDAAMNDKRLCVGAVSVEHRCLTFRPAKAPERNCDNAERRGSVMFMNGKSPILVQSYFANENPAAACSETLRACRTWASKQRGRSCSVLGLSGGEISVDFGQ